MKTYLYRASNLTSTRFWPLIHSGSQFLAPGKNRQFLRFILASEAKLTNKRGKLKKKLKISIV